ncbi:hypothetical protein [Pelagibacterium lacus]|uniref:Uncharacterized protein n=1 Tax=Pelagibacterium lacus TaxID=2282655 RepID=A0A369W3L7_9HYPH|nr:hypothetical protein [Pelagibacterium lacus]RDE09276.1 hypothetical protein DVH29_07405 [Pelagibacterium lacus]
MMKCMSLPIALILAAMPHAASAQQGDEVEVVEARPHMEVELIDADFLRPEDPSDSVFGGTTQFLSGAPILIELELIEPISAFQLDAMKAAASDGRTHFSCEEAVLYLANGWHVAMGHRCAPADLPQGETP